MLAKEGGRIRPLKGHEEVRGGTRGQAGGEARQGGHSDGQRQRISTVEAADGKGGNSGAGALSDVIFVNINNKK